MLSVRLGPGYAHLVNAVRARRVHLDPVIIQVVVLIVGATPLSYTYTRVPHQQNELRHHRKRHRIDRPQGVLIEKHD